MQFSEKSAETNTNQVQLYFEKIAFHAQYKNSTIVSFREIDSVLLLEWTVKGQTT